MDSKTEVPDIKLRRELSTGSKDSAAESDTSEAFILQQPSASGYQSPPHEKQRGILVLESPAASDDCGAVSETDEKPSAAGQAAAKTSLVYPRSRSEEPRGLNTTRKFSAEVSESANNMRRLSRSPSKSPPSGSTSIKLDVSDRSSFMATEERPSFSRIPAPNLLNESDSKRAVGFLTPVGSNSSRYTSPSAPVRILNFEKLIEAHQVNSNGSSNASQQTEKSPYQHGNFSPNPVVTVNLPARNSEDSSGVPVAESRQIAQQRILMASAARSTVMRALGGNGSVKVEDRVQAYTLHHYVEDKQGPEKGEELYTKLYLPTIIAIVVPFCIAVLIFGLYFYGCTLVYSAAVAEPSVGSMKTKNFVLMIGILLSFVTMIGGGCALAYCILFSWFGIQRYYEIFAFSGKAASHFKFFNGLDVLTIKEEEPKIGTINLGCFNIHYTIGSLYKMIEEACRTINIYRSYISPDQLRTFQISPVRYYQLYNAITRGDREKIEAIREISMAPTINNGVSTESHPREDSSEVHSPLPNSNSPPLSPVPSGTVVAQNGGPEQISPPGPSILNINSKIDPTQRAPSQDVGEEIVTSILTKKMSAYRPANVITQRVKEHAIISMRRDGNSQKMPSVSPARFLTDELTLTQTANRTTALRNAMVDVEASISRFGGFEDSMVFPPASAFRMESTLNLADTGVFARPELELGPLVTFIACKLFFHPSFFRVSGGIKKEVVPTIEEICKIFHDSVYNVAKNSEGTVYDAKLNSAFILFNAVIPTPITTAIINAQQAELELATKLSQIEERFAEQKVYFKWSLVLHQACVANVAVRDPHNHLMFASPEMDFAYEVCDLALLLECPTLSLQAPHFENADVSAVPIDFIFNGDSDTIYLYKVKQKLSRDVEEKIGEGLVVGLSKLFDLQFNEAIASFEKIAKWDYSAEKLLNLCKLFLQKKSQGKDLELQSPANYCRFRPYWDFPESLADLLRLDYKTFVYQTSPKITPLIPPLALIKHQRTASNASTNAPPAEQKSSPRLLGDESPPPLQEGTFSATKRSANRRRRSSTVITIDENPSTFVTQRLQFSQRSGSRPGDASPSPPDASITQNNSELSIDTSMPNTQLSTTRVARNECSLFSPNVSEPLLGHLTRDVDLSLSSKDGVMGMFRSRVSSKVLLGNLSSEGSKSSKKKVIIHKHKDSVPVIPLPPSAGEIQEDDSMDGSDLLQFTLGARIGRGTGGREVFQGLDERGRIVAIKQIPVEKNSKEVEDANREIETLSSLKNANITKYIASCYEEPYLYIVMEYVSGGTLTGFLENFGGRLPYEVVRRYAIGILRGLKYLHSKNIIHRDISLNNVLVSIDGLCKLSDFGGSVATIGKIDDFGSVRAESFATFAGSPNTTFLLESASNLTPLHPSKRSDGQENSQEEPLMTDTIFGTPIYMSPQACQGIVDARNDIWSVGILLCYIASGYPPWKEEDMEDRSSFLLKIATGEIQPQIPYAYINNKLASFLEKCLAPELKDRPSAAQLLLDPFTAQV